MELFESKNQKDSIGFNLLNEKYTSKFDSLFGGNIDLVVFFSNYGGASYDKGLFRIHSKSSSVYWSNLVSEFFPKYKNRICCFGYDWMGRQFAMDIINPNKSYLFDPATGEDFVLSQNLEGFFNEELVDYRDDTLAPEDFNYIRNKFALNILMPDKCIGYEKLLFLGGEDDLDNTEIIDLDVYWDLNYKVYSKIRNMEEGSIIEKLKYLK